MYLLCVHYQTTGLCHSPPLLTEDSLFEGQTKIKIINLIYHKVSKRSFFKMYLDIFN